MQEKTTGLAAETAMGTALRTKQRLLSILQQGHSGYVIFHTVSLCCCAGKDPTLLLLHTLCTFTCLSCKTAKDFPSVKNKALLKFKNFWNRR